MDFMQEAIRQAQIAKQHGEVPIGCVIVKDGKIIATPLANYSASAQVTAQQAQQQKKQNKWWRKAWNFLKKNKHYVSRIISTSAGNIKVTFKHK